MSTSNPIFRLSMKTYSSPKSTVPARTHDSFAIAGVLVSNPQESGPGAIPKLTSVTWIWHGKLEIFVAFRKMSENTRTVYGECQRPTALLS